MLQAQKRLVLVSSNAGDIDILKAAVRKVGDMGAPIVTAVWNYDGTPADLTALVNSLVATHGTFKTIAMVCHDGCRYETAVPILSDEELDAMIQKQRAHMVETWKKLGEPRLEDGAPDRSKIEEALRLRLSTAPEASPGVPEKWFITASGGVDLAEATSDVGVDEVFQAVADAASVRVDILACSLADTQAGKEWVMHWEKKTNTNFAASTNLTGNAEVGADWILETDGIDVCAVYFHEEKIKDWEVTLGKGKRVCYVGFCGAGCGAKDPKKANRTDRSSGICTPCIKAKWSKEKADEWRDKFWRGFGVISFGVDGLPL